MNATSPRSLRPADPSESPLRLRRKSPPTRLWLILAGVFVATLVYPVANHRYSNTPTHPARLPIQIESLVDRNPAVREWAKGELAKMGTNALPAIIARMRVRPSWIERQYGRLAALFDGFLHEPQPIVDLHAPAVAACYCLGPQAEPALPALSALLFDAPTAQVALALASIGGPALEPVCRAVADRNPDTRYFAMIALANLVKRAEAAQPSSSCHAADWANPPQRLSDATLAALVRNLAEPDVRQRVAAAWTLGELSQTAKPALPTLNAALADAEPMVRARARWAIDRIRGPSDSAAHTRAESAINVGREPAETPADVSDTGKPRTTQMTSR